MSGQHFTFPPPPPAPPQTSQSYPAYSQPSPGYRGYGWRGNRGDRGKRGHGRWNGRGGPKGGNFGSSHSTTTGYGGYPTRDARYPGSSDAGYNTQSAGQGTGGYPLPDYPPVQLPQYPANVGLDYGRQPSNFPVQHSGSQPLQAGYHPYGRTDRQYHNGQQPYSAHGYGSPVHSVQPMSQGFQSNGAVPPNQNNSAHQTVLMGPPMRMGFDEHRMGHQPLPQPTATGTISFHNGPLDSNSSPYRHNSPMSFQNPRHDSPNPFPGHRGRGQKRGRGEAFGTLRNQNPRPQAAPAVPSFGGALPLPSKPPIPQDRARKPRKKKRKHNQLGLTPKTEEHESSEEEEDDADEEARLAAAAAGSSASSQTLQFEYRGQTSTLQCSSDIAAWIEERRKRFPTKARAAEAAERQRQREEAQKAASQARREAQEKQRAEAQERQRQKMEVEQERKKPKDVSEDPAARAKRKVEKLRKRLEKEEKRVAKAEAKATKTKSEDYAEGDGEKGPTEINAAKKRKRSDSEVSNSTAFVGADNTKGGALGQTSAEATDTRVEHKMLLKQEDSATTVHDLALNNPQQKVQDAVHPVPDPLTPTSQPPVPSDTVDLSLPPLNLESTPNGLNLVIDAVGGGSPTQALPTQNDECDQHSSVSMSDSSSEISTTDSEDLTSSSGSSSSDSDGDNDAPEQASSRRNEPEKVLAPKRKKPDQICKEFLRRGRCRRGDDCRYRHELPERGSRGRRGKEDKKTQARPERVGLHQRLVEQEKEKEAHEILKAIIDLGKKGLLDQEAPGKSAED